jgi:hypothetical protein
MRSTRSTLHILHFAHRVQGREQPGSVPHRLVCGLALYPDAIIPVIRTRKIPFIQNRARWPLIITSSIIVAAGA